MKIFSYPCYLPECIPLRVVKADLLFNNVSGHQTPVNLQVDGHQKQTLRKQIHLYKKDQVKASHSAFSSFLKSVDHVFLFPNLCLTAAIYIINTDK